jgi:hypothetical protein
MQLSFDVVVLVDSFGLFGVEYDKATVRYRTDTPQHCMNQMVA